MSDSVADLFERYGPAYRWLVTAAGMTGVVAMVLSATIANVAVPSVMGAFGVGQDQAQWLATAFIATMTAGQLLNAWIVAALGRRTGYVLLILFFFVGTLIAAGSPNMDVLALGRVIQGFCAGAVQPLVLVTIFSVFPPDRRGMAMGIYGMAIMLAPGLGPLIGGMAIDALSWRHMFLIPLPLLAVALGLGMIFMPGKARRGPVPPFDWTGFLLLCAALFFLLTGIANGQRDGWLSDRSLLTFGIGALCAAGFVYSQLRSDEPLLDLTLFRIPVFAAAVLVAFVFGVGNFATNYAIPVFVQTVQGYTATKAGFVLVPAGLLLMAVFPVTGRLADRVPHHLPIMFGLVLFALGAGLMMGADVNTAFWSVALFTVIGRLGQSFILPSLNASALRALPPDRLNRGSGTINFLRQLGGAVGVNGLVAFIEQRTQFHADALTATQTSGNAASRAFLEGVGRILGESGVAETLRAPGALHYLGQVVQAQAKTMGFQDGFMVLAVVFLLALGPAWILGRARRSTRR